MPLPERLKMLSANMVNNIVANPRHAAYSFLVDLGRVPGKKPYLFELFNQKCHDLNVIAAPKHQFFLHSYDSLYYIPPIIFLQVKKKKCTPEDVCKRFEVFNRGNWAYFHKIFTDGSKTRLKTGAGVWFPEQSLEARFDINHDSTIFTAEAFAIVEALKMIEL